MLTANTSSIVRALAAAGATRMEGAPSSDPDGAHDLCPVGTQCMSGAQLPVCTSRGTSVLSRFFRAADEHRRAQVPGRVCRLLRRPGLRGDHLWMRGRGRQRGRRTLPRGSPAASSVAPARRQRACLLLGARRRAPTRRRLECGDTLVVSTGVGVASASPARRCRHRVTACSLACIALRDRRGDARRSLRSAGGQAGKQDEDPARLLPDRDAHRLRVRRAAALSG